MVFSQDVIPRSATAAKYSAGFFQPKCRPSTAQTCASERITVRISSVRVVYSFFFFFFSVSRGKEELAAYISLLDDKILGLTFSVDGDSWGARIFSEPGSFESLALESDSPY